MLKIVLLLAGAYLTTCTFAQKATLQNLWVGDKNNYLSIADTTLIVQNAFYNDFMHQDQMGIAWYRYKVKGDTLKIWDEYKVTEIHDFIIQALSDKRLSIKAVDTLSSTYIDFTQPRSQAFHFSNAESVRTDSIRFEKMLFHATSCYGPCPVMSLKIDADKQFWFIGKQHAVKQGFYKARLSDKLYQELLDILSMAELDKLASTNDDMSYSDVPTNAMEVYYNGKMKYVKGTIFPLIAKLLLIYLKSLPGKVALEASEQPFEITFSTKY